MLKRVLIFFLFIPVFVHAQYHITGRVVDIVSKKPIADASVLLSNASAGAKANDDGTFTISNVRGGQYDLIVSIIGYETYKQTVMVNKDIDIGDIGILQQSVMLNEVRIGPDKHWADHYAHFKRVFLGLTDNAEECDISNPHILSFSEEDGVFSATADGFLQIVNKALGYKIKYMLSSFTDNTKTGEMYYEGSAFFEDMPGKPRQIKKWKNNRQLTYFGSDMHFYRSIIANQVKEDGFTARRIIRKPNPAYKGGRDAKYIETLVTTPLKTDEYSRITDQKGQYAIEFKDCMQIIYKDNGLSASTITIGTKYAFFDNNGIILNPQHVIMEGNWGEKRVADMLPVDYEPGQQ